MRRGIAILLGRLQPLTLAPDFSDSSGHRPQAPAFEVTVQGTRH